MAQEENLNTIQKGHQAQTTLSQIADKLLDREEIVINNLIREYDGKTLSQLTMIGGIGELRALRGLQQDLHSDIEKGRIALEKEHTDG